MLKIINLFITGTKGITCYDKINKCTKKYVFKTDTFVFSIKLTFLIILTSTQRIKNTGNR